MPAPWIRILDFSEHSHQSAKWAHCKHQFVIVKITQQMSVAALDSSFFISFVGAVGDNPQRGMLCQTTLSLLKLGLVEVRLSANQNLSDGL